MGNQDQAKLEKLRVGLCTDCVHARRIESDRGAVFYLCGLAAVNPVFRKYPALPVLLCGGYEQAEVSPAERA